MDAAEQRDLEIVDETRAVGAFDPDDVGISLPSSEEIKAEINVRRQPRPYKAIGVAVVCLLAIIIGLSVGLSGSPSSASNASANGGVGGQDQTNGETPEDDGNGNSGETQDDSGNVGFDGFGSADRYFQAFSYLKAVSSVEALKLSGSPQNKACNWISNGDGRALDIPTNVSIDDAYVFVQRYVLALLYYGMNGEKWIWPSRFLNQDDECLWNIGMRTEDDTYKFGADCVGGRVSHLFMPGNNMTGSLPEELGFLTFLSHFSVYGNSITGELPSSFGQLTRLRTFAAENCYLEGPLPAWIGNWHRLEYLALGGNYFKGTIPEAIGDLKELFEVSLYDNALTGSVDFFADLPNLRRLFLGDNPLGITIGEDFLLGANIRELGLPNTTLKGTIPSHFLTSNLVKVLDLHGNELTGSLPSLTVTNDELQFFSIFKNKLKGSIPSSIANLEGLVHLDLSSNDLTGTIPPEIDDMTSLTSLFLSWNTFLAGRFPSIWSLTSLEELSLRRTTLTGPIPTEIGLLQNLTLLDLSRNKLTGKIPKDIGEIEGLSFLLLNENLLTGTLTVGFKSLDNLKLLLLEDNDIRGGAEHVCSSRGKPDESVLIMSADSPGEYNCSCCTQNCSNLHICYGDEMLLANVDDLFYDEAFRESDTYGRSDYIFDENIAFTKHASKIEN